MRSAIFLSARNKSKRLPHKEFAEICNRPAIAHLIDRLKSARRPDLVVLTTSTHLDDLVLCELAERDGIPAFRGSEDDKLDRYLRAARQHDVDFIAVVDGDDLLCDPEHIDKVIETAQRTGADYVTAAGLPLGATCFGVRREAVERVCALKAETDTEVWGAYFTESGLFTNASVEVEDALLRRPEVRMTLDYPEDLAFFRAVFERLYRPDRVFSLRDVMDLLRREPQIEALNRGVQEAYEENLLRSAPARLRQPAAAAADSDRRGRSSVAGDRG